MAETHISLRTSLTIFKMRSRNQSECSNVPPDRAMAPQGAKAAATAPHNTFRHQIRQHPLTKLQLIINCMTLQIHSATNDPAHNTAKKFGKHIRNTAKRKKGRRHGAEQDRHARILQIVA